MNRLLISFTALLSGLLPLILDSALKGVALLALASITAFVLYKSSAATRHLVWLVAVVALLIVPVLSLALPKWRVLPKWTATSLGQTTELAIPTSTQRSSEQPALTTTSAPLSTPLVTKGTITTTTSAAKPSFPVSDPVPVRQTMEMSTRPFEWLPLAWATGFMLLFLRLLASHLLLRRSAHRGLAPAADEAITTLFSTVSAELNIRQRVNLVVDEGRTIPLVWGVIRPHLLLPAEAREWSGEQLRSVLLHELAHLRRRDPLVQWLTQIACALHWWNPLVWFAAWRVHVERERACDDLVLTSGVRPSAYAEHLLHVATKLAPPRWTQSCGLAMAQKSSLEGRLLAVLNEKRNRRRVTTTLSVVALVLGTGIAVPIAMLRADDDDEKSNSPHAIDLEPEHDESQALFKQWQANARTDGKIPGALIGRLGEEVNYFISLNKDVQAGQDFAAEFEALLPRLEASRDWTHADAVTLLDDIAAISSGPVTNTISKAAEDTIRSGQPLPAELETAAWGHPAQNGLRVAWHLEPQAMEYPLGSSLKSRILVHNSGEEPVVFIMPSWQQSSEHTANDATGAPIKVSSIDWTTMARRTTFRLAPGEYLESPAPGVGIGAETENQDGANARVGAWIEAKVGDEVRFTPGAVEVRCSPSVIGTRIVNGVPENVEPKDATQLWERIVAERVRRELPIPSGAADREQLLRRATLDLFGESPTPR